MLSYVPVQIHGGATIFDVGGNVGAQLKA